MKKLLSGLIGLLCFGAIVYFGFKTLESSTINTVIFGIACAILSPIVISTVGSLFKKKDDNHSQELEEILERLSKVPNVDKLMQEVATQEERLKNIAKMKSELLEYIRNEAYLLAASERKNLLVEDARRIIAEIDNIDEKTKFILNQTQEEQDQEVKAIKERVKRIVTQRSNQGLIAISIGNFKIEIDTLFFNPFSNLISLIIGATTNSNRK